MTEATTKAQKDALRAECKAWRRNLDAAARERIDRAIAANVAALDAWRGAHTVLAYLSFGCEVDTRALIEQAWHEGKTVALPRCAARTCAMEWHRVTSFADLERSPLGVDEPPRNPATLIDAAALDPKRTVALVPGLAFDGCGFRLGYGGGFYDAFLAQSNCTSIGLCRAGQLRESLAALGVVDGHDEPVSIVVTE